MNNDIIAEARKKVKAKRRLYWHLSIYALVAGPMITIAILAFPHGPSAPFTLFSIIWAIALVIHFIRVKVLGSDWEKKEMEREILRIQEKRQFLLESAEDDILDINEKDYLKLKEWEREKRIRN